MYPFKEINTPSGGHFKSKGTLNIKYYKKV